MDWSEVRRLVEDAEAGVEEMRREGRDPGDIAEAEHNAKQARWHLNVAERVADRGAVLREHKDD
jgi:hypothetical protein